MPLLRKVISVPAAPLLALSFTFAFTVPPRAVGIPPRVESVRFWSFGDVTRIAIETEGDYKLASDQIENPWRAYFDLTGLQPPPFAARGMQTIKVGDHMVKQIRIAQVLPGKTRIVLDLECPVEIVSSQLVNPDRLMIEIRPKGTSLPALSAARTVTGSQRVELTSLPTEADKDLIENTDVPKPTPQKILQSFEPRQQEPAKSELASPIGGRTSPPTLAPDTTHASVVETASRQPAAPRSPDVPKMVAPNMTGVAPAKADGSGDRSLVRVFGLKLGRVVIDAGHGGKDTGTIGPNGLMEKDLVLDVALKLGKLVTQQLGAEVVYTRSDDTFIPLEERSAIANREKADLFISVHANSSPAASATGVETYYFNLTSDKKGLDLAMRENASSGSSISDLNDLLHRAVLQAKLEESREFAQQVQESLFLNSEKMNGHARDRGVRQAPFVVLIGPTMPSILAEIGFVSNPHDERLMKRGDQRQKIAEALLKGITQYANSLSHTQIARAGP